MSRNNKNLKLTIMNTQNALLKQKKNGSLIIQDDVTVPLKRMKAIEIIVDSTHPINDNPDSDIYYESLSNAPSMINLEDIGIIDETILRCMLFRWCVEAE